MSSIRARPDSGRLYFDFHLAGQRCREYTTLEDTPVNRRKMDTVLKKIEAEITLGTFDYAKYFPNSKMLTKLPAATNAGSSHQAAVADSPLFENFAQQWAREKSVEWRVSYRESVDSILKAHLLPEFGTRTIASIDRAAVLDFRSRLGAVRNGSILSSSTINRVVGILRMILEEASIRHGTVNPCLSVKRLKIQKVDVQPFTVEEVRTILATVRADYRQYLTIRFFTGMRSGEANGLKWKHIDAARRQILIRETIIRGRTEYTKNDGSQREIDMSQVVFECFLSIKPADAGDEDYVFHTRTGGPIDNKNFNDRVWQPLLRYLSLKRRRPYQMRHTCATLWLAAGENPEWIARQLGHTTTEMLFRVYSRYVPNLTRRDGSAFDRMVSAAMNGGIASDSSSAKKETDHA